jgi:parvulin-like peptidyl-prolyl isomerase
MNWRTFYLLPLLAALGAAPLTAQAGATGKNTAANDVMNPSGKAVVRVNGTVLTDRDLLREMMAIFPYSRQHGGHFPKEMEADIRKGALQMMEFEELVYQEAQRRNMQLSNSRLEQATIEFKKQFPSEQEYQNFLKTECQGSEKTLREKVRRSLLIENILNAEITQKAGVSEAELRHYYDLHKNRFYTPEQVWIQTISIGIPDNLLQPDAMKVRQRAEEILGKAKATKNYEEFGMLAEKVSDDDWRVMMGDHKAISREKMPPPVADVAFQMKPNQVSELIRAENSWCIVRLIEKIAAHQVTYDQVKASLKLEMERSKADGLRQALNRRLRKSAKVEEL